MAAPWTGLHSDLVVDKVLKRAEVSKMARKLQNRLALARYKTNRGWENLTLDTIEPRVEDERRQRRPQSSGDVLSDSSSSTTSDHLHTLPRTLMSSPLKATIFSDQLASGGSQGARKRFYQPTSSSSSGSRKRLCSSPLGGRSFDTHHASWRDTHALTQSSPIKARRQIHFTTSQGPHLSFYNRPSHLPSPSLQQSPDLPSSSTSSEDGHHSAALHSFDIRSSPPRTPPPTRPLDGSGRRPKDPRPEEGADLLLYLASSPSPAKPLHHRLHTPSTPPQKNMALPSSVMHTPGGDGGGGSAHQPSNSLFGAPATPSQSQGFNFADFVHITPSPAQSAWPRTPRTIKTPLTVARRRLNFDNIGPDRP